VGPENSAAGFILGHGVDVIRQHFVDETGMHPEGMKLRLFAVIVLAGVYFAAHIGLFESQVQLPEGKNAFV
jgi:hypothetical protein